jgi:hypothetical protein
VTWGRGCCRNQRESSGKGGCFRMGHSGSSSGGHGAGVNSTSYTAIVRAAVAWRRRGSSSGGIILGRGVLPKSIGSHARGPAVPGAGAQAVGVVHGTGGSATIYKE